MTKRFSRGGAGVVATVLVALLVIAQPASATTRSWIASPQYPPYPANWHCASKTVGLIDVDSCLINSRNTVEPVYKAVLIVWNNNWKGGVQMRGAVTNIWAAPAPSTQIADDGCYDSGLSYRQWAGCYGSQITRTQLCTRKPNASGVTAASAVYVDGQRIAVTSPLVEVIC
jgi:hypothetical protein